MKNDINKMSRKDFEALPLNKWNNDIGELDSLIILPTRHIHDSGYRCLDFVAVRDNKPLCRLSGCSDVVHIEGIGGFGFNWRNRYGTYPKLIPPTEWSIDCLAVSGLFRLFTRGKIKTGDALSSFEIYSVPKSKEE